MNIGMAVSDLFTGKFLIKDRVKAWNTSRCLLYVRALQYHREHGLFSIPELSITINVIALSYRLVSSYTRSSMLIIYAHAHHPRPGSCPSPSEISTVGILPKQRQYSVSSLHQLRTLRLLARH